MASTIALMKTPRNLDRLRYPFALIAFLLATNACLSKASKPNLPQIFPAQKPAGKAPLILIPGILGSELVNQKTGERLWPELFPKDRAALHLPIASRNLAENRDDVIAVRVIESAQLVSFLPELGVYGALLEALEKHGGYRRGDIDNPPADGDRDTFYLFAYDWRRDNVETARLLAAKIARIKARFNRPDLRFDLIAHSMGGLVARYYAMYGDRDLPADGSPQPDWSGARHIQRLVMFGTPNAGSMDAFRSVLRGYSVTEANKPRLRLFRALDFTMIFTVPSVYQLFPRNDTARFLNAELKSVAVDLFDVETWKRYGWSARFDPGFRPTEQRAFVRRLGEAAGLAAFEKLDDERLNYLQVALARAAAFHRALDADSAPPAELRLHLVGGDCEPTLAGVLLVELHGRTRTNFYPRDLPRKLRNRAFDLLFIPGDGRVTRHSLFGLAIHPETNEPVGRAMKLSPAQTLFGCEAHGDLPINPTMMDNLLTLLLGNGY
jgi:pimeloyl-ACP methyl ester carboxylesterase